MSETTSRITTRVARPRATPQQIDPLGALSARPVTMVAAASAWLFALVSTLVRSHDVVVAWAAAGALAAVAAAGVVLVVAADPLRAPFRRHATVAVGLACAVAAVLAAVSTAGENPFVRDDWTGITVGILVLGLAPYRGAREILTVGVLLAVVVGCVVVSQSSSFVTPVPVPVYVVVAITPLLALASAGAVFSAVFVDHVTAWIERAGRFRRSSTDELRVALARSVQQDRVTVLNREVVPFFTQLLESGRVEVDDPARARRISESLRASLVADADSTWLDRMLQSPARRVPATVDDVRRAASGMGSRHRTALWALLDAVDDVDLVSVRSLSVALSVEEARVVVQLAVATASSSAVARRALAPYLAVLRVVADDLRVDRAPSLLTLRFSYDQH